MDSTYVDDLIDADEIPELTEEESANMVPFGQLPQELKHMLLQVEHATSRPDSPPQEEVTLKLSRPVLERFRASGSGWEHRVDQALQQWMEEHKAS